ncbi:hypothetical protein Vadar_024388 [Vaccinium darrowii]|uniref:Uncharacterized protein n=1 Tax=Vaccinium darrowii TaxID=229202 RepID=A0ACB7YFQ9_9ERIC|nr:hypothetical protein Vadar_024388 [Vaccinium darrowii]
MSIRVTIVADSIWCFLISHRTEEEKLESEYGRAKRKGEARGEWRADFHRGNKSENKDLVTLFVDNIPDEKDHTWLKKTFNNFGLVLYAFSPYKRSKHACNKFGFVRFNCLASVGTAISSMNGTVENNRLFVKEAYFGHNEKKTEHKLPTFQELRKQTRRQNERCNQKYGAPQKIFAEALNGENFECRDAEGTEYYTQNQPTGNEWLHRSAVAVMHDIASMQSLNVSFKLETGFEAHFRALRGRSMLILFQSPEDRDSLIKVMWMKRWFEDIKPWSNEAASFERILIATKENSKIEKWIKIDVGGVMYVVKVTKESSFSNPDAIGAIVSMEKDAQDDSKSKEKILLEPNSLSKPSEDEEEDDDVDALAIGKLQEFSNDQVSLGGFESIVEESPNHDCDGLEIPKTDEEKEGEIPVDDNSFMELDLFGINTNDTLSNCDSMVGDFSKDIDSFEGKYFG